MGGDVGYICGLHAAFDQTQRFGGADGSFQFLEGNGSGSSSCRNTSFAMLSGEERRKRAVRSKASRTIGSRSTEMGDGGVSLLTGLFYTREWAGESKDGGHGDQGRENR